MKYAFVGAIEGVHFAYDKAELRPDSHTVLDTTAETIALALKAEPDLLIEVHGHTDSDGELTYNRELSHARAETVREYLIQKGIPPHNLRARGYGESVPTASNETDDGRALNRRVELHVVER